MMRCRQCCGGATDLSTSTEQWTSRLCEEMVVPILRGAAYVCVPEARNVRIVIDDFEQGSWHCLKSRDELKEMSSDG